MTYESSLAVARIIQRCDEQHADVLSVRHEVSWPDGSRVGLHPVRQHGADAQYLRALHAEGHWVLFDLRQQVPAIAADLARAHLRDQPGTVLYALRGHYTTAMAFVVHAVAHHLAMWPGSPRAAEPCPARSSGVAA